jgi:ABC-type Mn2+/Zn2+ transport system ATPase subunit
MNKQPLLKIEQLCVCYGKHIALHNISLSLSLGPLTGIVGPNGAGKSTLLKTLCQLMTPSKGRITLEGQLFSSFKSVMAYVPQKKEMNFDFPILVEEVVAQGALSQKKWYQRLNKHDFDKARLLLKRLDLDLLAQKGIGELSGGQQQRVLLARALMQEAKILFLDEPFVGLDVVSEEALMKELKKLSAEGMAIFIVHHDLHSWKKYFEQLVILNKDLIAAGPFAEVFTQANLQKAYGINLVDCSC